MIALGAIFVFTLKNFVQLQFKVSELSDKAKNLRNVIWGSIVFGALFFVTFEFSDSLGIKVNCNAYQQKHHPEQCEGLND